jgi:hypothetical protein
MNKENPQDLPKIGYLYHFPSVDHPTDKFRLDIYISSIPTEQHFDVLHVILNTESQYGGLERLKVTHPWEYQSPYRVCPGKVILEDRKDKKDEAFCFGGQLTVNVKKTLTECVLTSPAPILEINQNRPLQALFIMEVEMLLAEYRAEYPDECDFEMHLCAADPFDLYTACLRKLIVSYSSKTYKENTHPQFLNYLHKEEYRLHLAGLFKDLAPSLDEIFTTNK